MCFFDQEFFICGDWRWLSFWEYCSKTGHPNSPCGMTLIMTSFFCEGKCHTCQSIEVKQRRINALVDQVQHRRADIARQTSSIQRAKASIHALRAQICQQERMRTINLHKNTSSSYGKHHHHAQQIPFIISQPEHECMLRCKSTRVIF